MPPATARPALFVAALPPRRLRRASPRVPLAARSLPRAVAADPPPKRSPPPVWRRALAIAAFAAQLLRPAPLRALPDASSPPSSASALAATHPRRRSRPAAIAVTPQRPTQQRLRQSLLTRSDHGDDHSHQHAVNDALVLLISTVLIIPLARRFGISPILGFLAAGVALGPNAFALVNDVRTTKALAELGVVFFLFEMGLELSTSKLNSLRADVFGLGTAQFFVTGAIITAAAIAAGITSQAAIVVGAALALSSSAFVLQLLSERGEVGTRYGRAAFGILLFQDLVVVPVLVLIPLLAASGAASAVWRAVGVASIKAVLALAFIIFMGNNALQPVFRFVARARSPEAFIAVILLTVLGTSSLTQMLGLSDTLGAFLAGVMLAETKFRHQVEADIKPFRGLLLGLFFMTVGFSIDLNLAWANLSKVVSLVSGLLAIKASVIAAAGVAFGLSVGSAIRTGLLLSQGGEFAFVIFGLGQKVGVLPPDLSQLLLLVVAISMAVTPLLAAIGRRISTELEKKRGLIGVRMEDADTADARDFVMVAGWGRVGQSVCEMLDAKLVRYMAFDMSPTRVIHARNKGFPVFFGDASRPEVLRAAGVERARAVVVTLDDPEQALRAVQNIRREFEGVKVFCRARDARHQKLLQASGATAIVPELLEASLQLGGAVLLDYGTPMDEVNSLVEEARAENLAELGIADGATASIGSAFKKSVSPQKVEDESEEGEVVEEEDESEEEPILIPQDGDVKSEDVPTVGSAGDVTEDIYEPADQVAVAAEDGTARGKTTAVAEDPESDSVR
ncbi:K(+) efflux antiporter 3, chloroplastic [Gracilariopsis chorda]|uniref:K(+) efflux antiporter 3, chloroplastic n=1 Tax=Gracilariopsis chorda TaxID=448386 RepID=A0A2V3IWA5_9FLOR|nr:K(+) efflux antiporter 3, chloroplastic [Gracilariopsis chorda]|eukprot:PXF46412.1 K(+) efflux antiporter 3, chloroplastic [Gracilariopsis chorda]